MKKRLASILVISTILLASCSASSTSTPMNSAEEDLPIETQLAVGTLKLSGTEQDISLEQAEDLVLYWQVYKQLSQSDTAAQAEVDGLIAQIQESMSGDQLQAISDMNITQQDVFASMQGVSVISSNASDNMVSLPSGPAGAGGPPADGGGSPPDGGTPADMVGAAPGSSAEESQIAAVSAGVPTALVQAVIDSLQQKIAS